MMKEQETRLVPIEWQILGSIRKLAQFFAIIFYFPPPKLILPCLSRTYI